jgi:hypothetical protein
MVDQELVVAYARDGSDTAFQELVSNSRLSRVNEPMISVLAIILFIFSLQVWPKCSQSAFRHLGKIGHFLLVPEII